MVGKLHLFAAACVLAFAFVSEVYSQSACITATWGNTTGIPYKYLVKPLPPPYKDWQVTIKNPCKGTPNGIVATVCDIDRPPIATFMNQYVLFVKRTGITQGMATVDIIVFCQELAYGATLQSVPQVQSIIQKN